MSPLKQVLAVFQDAAQPLSIHQIARQVGVEPALVEDMIAFWVRKGKLRDSSACTPTNCGSCAIGSGGCPFVVNMPRRYELVSEEPRLSNGLVTIEEIQ